jgi:hypothetical protein
MKKPEPVFDLKEFADDDIKWTDSEAEDEK